MAPHSSTLAWKIPWMEELGRPQSMGSLRVGHDWATSLSLFTFHFHALEKEMATHSSVLAWRIPGTGEPGRRLSMGSHRVRHNWSDLAAAAAAAAVCSVLCLYPESVNGHYFLKGFVWEIYPFLLAPISTLSIYSYVLIEFKGMEYMQNLPIHFWYCNLAVCLVRLGED